MKFAEAYPSGKFGVSFELFPPKTEKGEAALFRNVERLVEQKPSLITCTYGAGGSTRNKTLDITSRVHADFGVSVAAHLTCVGSTVDELRSFLRDAQARGIENIVALRGDPPKGEKEFKAVEGGLRYANELVAMLRSEFPDFGIAVAGYPETHQEAPSPEIDLENLKRKVDAGADVVITQLFYNNEDFLKFRADLEAQNIRVPIIPGLLPVTNLAQIKRITSLCGAKLPKGVVDALSEHEGNDAGQFDVGVEYAVRQTQELIDASVPGIHFYVLNKSEATTRVLDSVSMPAA